VRIDLGRKIVSELPDLGKQEDSTNHPALSCAKTMKPENALDGVLQERGGQTGKVGKKTEILKVARVWRSWYAKTIRKKIPYV